MSTNTNPIFVGSRRVDALELDTADGTTAIAFVAAGANGSRIDAIAASSTDTSAVELVFTLNDGSADFSIGSATIAAEAGTDGGTTPAVDLLTQADLPWLRDDLSIFLESGQTLKVGAYAAITAAKVVHLVAFGGDY